MELAGQLAAGRHQRGYAMVALLIAMSVMAVLMSALLPQWTTMARREKEAELVFRGNQYARAVALFQRKFANAAPPSIDVLVEQRFLRKKYKDPITNDDFQPLYANQAMTPGGVGGPGQQQSGQQQAGQQRGATGAPGGQLLQPGFGATGATGAGGIIGVTSKSKDTSLRVFNGRTRYNEWAFVNVQTSQRIGQPGGGGAPGQPGGPNQRPGQQPQQPSPFNQNSPFGTNPNQRPAMPMQPPGMGTSRPPMPGSFSPPNGGSPFTPFQPQPQPQPQRRPPGQ
jgi:type II secretory pathway pseudopilin PulG